MKEEHGGKDGWVVEDCGIAGYLLIECSDCNISVPKLLHLLQCAGLYAVPTG